jgi:hypothetical protein
MAQQLFRAWGGAGGKTGISTHGDVLVNITADGVDLNEVWDEVQQVMEMYNAERKSITDLLSIKTVNIADAIAQSVTSDSFEEATEFGAPRAIRPPSDVLKLGYRFKDYDLALRSSWKFLREATAEQVQAGVTRILESDNKLTTGTVMQRLFDPTQYTNDWQTPCFGLWCGDGMVPPPYLGNTFDGTHTHYLITASTALYPTHVEGLINHVKEHGYGQNPGTTMLVLLNPADFDSSGISAWRANVEVTTGEAPKWDFIPSALMPAYISNEEIHGSPPASDFNNLQVWGSYGSALVIKSYYVPSGYCAVLATAGPNDSANPIGFRQHVNPSYQGLRHIPGPGPYPIQNSFFARGFGVGVRHRGAAAIAQIKASGSYTAPAAGVIPVCSPMPTV